MKYFAKRHFQLMIYKVCWSELCHSVFLEVGTSVLELYGASILTAIEGSDEFRKRKL